MLSFGVLAAASVMFAPADAWACSCASPAPVVYSAEGKVPSDFGGIAVWSGTYATELDSRTFALLRWVDDGWVDESIETEVFEELHGYGYIRPVLVLRPSTFEVGDRFLVRITDQEGQELTSAIDVSEPLPAISGALTLQIGEPEMKAVYVDSSGCEEPVWSASRSVTVGLPDALEPYRDLLFYETTVDGEQWHVTRNTCMPSPAGRSWQVKPATDRLAITCPTAESTRDNHNLLVGNSFSVQVHAYFPGTNHPVWSTATEDVDLECSDECVTWSYGEDNFVPCTGGEGGSENGGTGSEGGNGSGEGDGSGRDGGSTEAGTDSGCGCATTNNPASALLLLLGLAVARVLRRR